MAESDGDASVPKVRFKKRARPSNLIKRKREDSDQEDDVASPEGTSTLDEQANSHLSVAQNRLASDPVPQKPSKEMSELDRMQNRFVPATGQTQDMYQKQM